MRIFTGIALPEDATAALLTVADGLRKSYEDLRWTPPEKLHITLTFIGEWPEERLPDMKAALAQVAVPGPLAVNLHGLGWMPNPRFPHSMYVGVEVTPELQALAKASEQAIVPLGVAVEDRWYRPHVTLARVKGRLRSTPLPEDVGPIARFDASSFFLYLSSGGTYTKLDEFRLPPSL